jgi:hypothetical protein
VRHAAPAGKTLTVASVSRGVPGRNCAGQRAAFSSIGLSAGEFLNPKERAPPLRAGRGPCDWSRFEAPRYTSTGHASRVAKKRRAPASRARRCGRSAVSVARRYSGRIWHPFGRVDQCGLASEKPNCRHVSGAAHPPPTSRLDLAFRCGSPDPADSVVPFLYRATIRVLWALLWKEKPRRIGVRRGPGSVGTLPCGQLAHAKSGAYP